MTAVNIGIIKEGKIPTDRRTAITPEHALHIQQQYENVKVVCQKNDLRCFKNDEYIAKGIELVDSVEQCDILFGVKEVPIDQLIPKKTYFFFSHTIKKQEYNKELLKAILEKKITLVDYETLTDKAGRRVIAFGYWAGIVGAYNAIWTYGEKTNSYSLKRAYQCHDLIELHQELKNVKLPAVKIVLTGKGRVSTGAAEILDEAGVQKIDASEYLSKDFDTPVYVQLDADEYTAHINGKQFEFAHFFSHPQEYRSNFDPFLSKTDILISAAYWDPKSPRLFELSQTEHQNFKPSIIADISCDINGSVPTTIKASTIEDPLYDYGKNGKILAPFSDPENITMMTIDNLPNELPRDASTSFGNQLIENVLPELIGGVEGDMIQRATICSKGQLTENYKYLEEWVNS